MFFFNKFKNVVTLVILAACFASTYGHNTNPIRTSVERIVYSPDFGKTHTNLSLLCVHLDTIESKLTNTPASSDRHLTLERIKNQLITKYIAFANMISDCATDRLSNREYKQLNKFLEGEIEHNVNAWYDPPATNSRGQALAAFRGWIYYKSSATAPYKKLIPGEFPQWYVPLHTHESDESTKYFYVILPNGNEGGEELWLASLRGCYVGRIGHLPLKIDSVPVISYDGKTFAAIRRPTTVAEGNRYAVVCFRRPTNPQHRKESSQLPEETVYQTSRGIIRSLQWDGQILELKILQQTDLGARSVVLSLSNIISKTRGPIDHPAK